MDDDILRNGFGTKMAEKLKQIGAGGGNLDKYAAHFKTAQRKVEKKHFRDRMALLHHEKERTKIQREMGQDPYLDTAE
jgi:preprotein translocase subunit SecA